MRNKIGNQKALFVIFIAGCRIVNTDKVDSRGTPAKALVDLNQDSRVEHILYSARRCLEKPHQTEDE